MPHTTEAKRLLYALFGQFGKILDVVVMKGSGLRGRAWVAFTDVASATEALRAMQDFPFFNKPLVRRAAATGGRAAGRLLARQGGRGCPAPQSTARGPRWSARTPFPFPQHLSFAKTKSEVITRLEAGTKKAKKDRKDKTEAEVPAGTNGSAQPPQPLAPALRAADVGEPSETLFVENLPEATTTEMLTMLFSQYNGGCGEEGGEDRPGGGLRRFPAGVDTRHSRRVGSPERRPPRIGFAGFVEVRMVEARPGIAFVDYQNDAQVGPASEAAGLGNWSGPQCMAMVGRAVGTAPRSPEPCSW